MMKMIAHTILFLTILSNVFGAESFPEEAWLDSLDQAIRKRQEYVDAKLLQINNAKQQFQTPGISSEQQYKQISDLYRDSLLSVLTPESNHYRIVYAEKLAEEGKLAEADVRNAIKENAAMQALAILMYQTGDVNRAYKYIKCSLEDAIFCNAHMRTVEISAIFPIIDTAYQEKTIKQKNQMKLYLLLTAILSFSLIIAVGYVYQQMKRLAVARKELHNINLQLNDLNSQLLSANNRLKETNHRLFETNHLKEEYIGHFLDLCSTYIDKLESYRKMLLKKASASQWESLYATLKSNEFVDKELQTLYNHFDNIFLHLFPNFTEELNQLLKKEERFVLRQGELLNPELRIFALIRLGIGDSYKIAAFLHYSASTIYNYRTKVRNKAAVPRENFEDFVMKIGAFSEEKPE